MSGVRGNLVSLQKSADEFYLTELCIITNKIKPKIFAGKNQQLMVRDRVKLQTMKADSPR